MIVALCYAFIGLRAYIFPNHTCNEDSSSTLQYNGVYSLRLKSYGVHI